MTNTQTHSGTRRRFAGAVVVLTLASVTLSAIVIPAGAQSIDDKRAQANKIAIELAAASERAAHLYEQLKYVEGKLAQAQQTIADAAARIAAAEAEMARLKAIVEERAAAAYRSRSRGSHPSILEGDANEVAAREKYVAAASERDAHLLDQLDAARADLRQRERDARQAKKIAAAEKAKLDSIRTGFEAAQAKRQAALNKVNGDIAGLVAEAQARQAARETPKTGHNDSTFDPGTLPPATGRGGVALQYAQDQLGKPYCYAGTGPACYDCSGLTMMSWRAAGVALPHNSEAQYNSFPRVPMNALAPGDVVWYSGHVGLYAGNGAVIHASSSGNAVRYQSVSYYKGAVRPG